jgi:membrane fusion protein, multidrug efflux system
LFIGLVPGCGKSGGGAQEEQKGSQEVAVKVEEVATGNFSESVQLTGSLASFDDITVPAEEGGKLLAWAAPRGAHVKKGQVIARIDDAILKAAYEASNAQYQIAQLAVDKQTKVFEEQAISEFQMKSLEYQRDAAKAGADLARTRWEKTQVKSPIDGILNTRYIDEGEMIGPGMPLAQVVATGRLKILAGVPERYAGAFKVGDDLTFSVDALPGDRFAGRITFVGAAVQKDNRTIPIEATVSAAGGKLKPDMIAAMKIHLATRGNSVVIEDDYMQQVDKDKYVVYVEDNGVARERTIQVGAVNEGKVLVAGGLKPGEKLITLGFQNVADGQKITVSK